jgi:hypothetical protein
LLRIAFRLSEKDTIPTTHRFLPCGRYGSENFYDATVARERRGVVSNYGAVDEETGEILPLGFNIRRQLVEALQPAMFLTTASVVGILPDDLHIVEGCAGAG